MRRTGAAALVLLATAGCSGGDPAPGTDAERSARADRTAAERSPTGTPAPPGPAAPPVAERFVPARTPQALARRLSAAEDLVRDPATGGDVLAAAAFESQLLYRQLARRPGWDDRVLGTVAGRYRADVRDHLTARRSFARLVTTLSDTLPAWRIVEPAPVARLLAFYRKGQRTHGVPWEVLAAINLVETGFGRIDGVSVAGAQGPMQFIPSTWDAYGRGDVEDPHDAIQAAARYLAARGGAGDPAQLRQALFAYNNHVGYVDGVLAYASVLRRDPAALRGLYRWQIVYLSVVGDVWLPVGYRETDPVPVRRYVRQHPERHLGTRTD